MPETFTHVYAFNTKKQLERELVQIETSEILLKKCTEIKKSLTEQQPIISNENKLLPYYVEMLRDLLNVPPGPSYIVNEHIEKDDFTFNEDEFEPLIITQNEDEMVEPNVSNPQFEASLSPDIEDEKDNSEDDDFRPIDINKDVRSIAEYVKEFGELPSLTPIDSNHMETMDELPVRTPHADDDDDTPDIFGRTRADVEKELSTKHMEFESSISFINQFIQNVCADDHLAVNKFEQISLLLSIEKQVRKSVLLKPIYTTGVSNEKVIHSTDLFGIVEKEDGWFINGYKTQIPINGYNASVFCDLKTTGSTEDATQFHVTSVDDLTPYHTAFQDLYTIVTQSESSKYQPLQKIRQIIQIVNEKSIALEKQKLPTDTVQVDNASLMLIDTLLNIVTDLSNALQENRNNVETFNDKLNGYSVYVQYLLQIDLFIAKNHNSSTTFTWQGFVASEVGKGFLERLDAQARSTVDQTAKERAIITFQSRF